MKWRNVIAMEGAETNDKRLCEVESLEWPTLPIPLGRATVRPESLDIEVIGQIHSIHRDGRRIIGEGEVNVEIPEGAAIAVSVVGVESEIRGEVLTVIRGRIVNVVIHENTAPVWPEVVHHASE